jgi:AcrR family transcriptional regulator
MLAIVGRPKEHDERTAVALLDAAERTVETEGVASLSVRRVAAEVGTSVRAVYSVFGSKAALVVALGTRAFDWLASTMDDLPITEDPVADLVEAGTSVFRRFVVEHPALFRVAFGHGEVPPELTLEFRASAENALERLESRVVRLQAQDLLGGRSARHAVCEFHALCEGLAGLELRGILGPSDSEQIWRDALATLVAGWAALHAGGRSKSSGRPR